MNNKALPLLEESTRVSLVEHYLALRADGISIVVRAEQALGELGHPVDTAIRTREERRRVRRDTQEESA